MKSLYLSGSALSAIACFAKADTTAAPAADKPAAIQKVVYMSAEDSLKNVVLNVGHAADATLRLIASMVVHLVIRTYHHNEAERRDLKITKDELLSAFKEYAELKRGRPFQNAWVSRLLACSMAMARSLVKDYDKKGVVDGSPLSMILRAKTPQVGGEIVFEFIMGRTKGNNAFTALEKALSPAKKSGAGANAGQNAKGSNAVKASTDKPNRIAKAIEGDKGAEIINAIPGNAKAKAKKLADKVGQSNVDHVTFVMRSIGYLNTAEDCLAVSQRALERMKEIEQAAKEQPATPQEAQAKVG